MSKKLNNADEPNWGLFYREHRKDLDARKSIKVKLPIRQHIKLHALKLFTEKNISETVEKALDSYFSDMKDEDGVANGMTNLVNGAAARGDVSDVVASAEEATGVVADTDAGTRANGASTTDAGADANDSS